MKSFQKDSVTLDYKYYAKEDLKERTAFDVDLALLDSKSGTVIGGETFRVIQEPRPAILPLVSVLQETNGTATLSVSNVQESAQYEWYDSQGVYIGEGESCEVPVSANPVQYSVKAIADRDGAFNYATIRVVSTQAIKSVDASGHAAAQVVVAFQKPTDGSARLQLTSVSGSVSTREYSMGKGTQAYGIPVANLQNGVYQVSLIEDGHVIDTKKFVK